MSTNGVITSQLIWSHTKKQKKTQNNNTWCWKSWLWTR